MTQKAMEANDNQNSEEPQKPELHEGKKTKKRSKHMNGAHKISEILQFLADEKLKGDGEISILSILKEIKHRGFGIILLFFGLIGTLAVAPLSTLASIPLLIFSWQVFRSYNTPILPKAIYRKKFTKRKIKNALEKAIPYFEKVENYVRPRKIFFFEPRNEKIIALCMIIFALSISVPLPMTNLFPSLGIIAISIGFLEKDGNMIILGLILGFGGALFSATLLIGLLSILF